MFGLLEDLLRICPSLYGPVVGEIEVISMSNAYGNSTPYWPLGISRMKLSIATNKLQPCPGVCLPERRAVRYLALVNQLCSYRSNEKANDVGNLPAVQLVLISQSDRTA